MIIKKTANIALAVTLMVSVSISASVPDRPSVIAPKATESILLDIARTGTGQRLIVVGERGHILYSDNNGEQWQQAVVPTQKMLTAVSFPSARTGYAVGHDAIILRTTDGGATWQKIYDDIEQGIPLLDVHFISNNQGMAVGAYGLALKTENGGNTWQSISKNISNQDELHLNAIAGSSELLYLVGEQGIIFCSDDFGQSWQTLNANYNGSWFGMVEGSNKQLWLYGLRGTVHQSNNHGKTWAASGFEARHSIFGGTLLDQKNPVLVGDAGFISVRQQNRWFNWQLDQRQTLNAVLATNDRHLIVVGETGVKKIALETILSGDHP